jgi:2-polyprenyl-3-methyl-5-hydroxy-6-metoxy-1,4-benzoquinol methylase
MASPAHYSPPSGFSPGWTHRFAGWVADSFLLSHGRHLMQRNWENYFLPLSKVGKLSAGVYLILKDYSAGLFPPTFADQAKAYAAERDYYSSMPGAKREVVLAGHVQKPFWDPNNFATYIGKFTRLWRELEALELRPGARLLELGCGCGWMSEFLAIAGYHVLGTSIGPDEIGLAEKRITALRARGVDEVRLSFKEGPMETVDEVVAPARDFDGVFVFEALHHAFDWRQTIHAAFRCLKPGGWLLVADEPNRLHTFVSYRISRLTNTHEIGMSRPLLEAEMKRAGFREVRVLRPRWDNGVTPLWIAARK